MGDYQQDFKQISMQAKEKEKELKKWSESYDHLANSYHSEKEKHDELLYKVQEQNNIILDLSKDVEKYKD